MVNLGGAGFAADGCDKQMGKEEQTMNIWIDTIQAHDSDGKVIAYYPEVHWNIDEHDTISPDAMNQICDRLRNELEQGLKAARIER